MPRICVALLAFNAERELPALFEGLRSQTRPPDELVAFDDRSTDSTAASLEEFAAGAPFPVVVRRNERHFGAIEGAETVFAACTGDVIAIHDQSDVWKPNKLAAVEAAFGDETGLFASNGDLENATLWNASGFAAHAGEDLLPLLVTHPFLASGTMAFRADLREVLLPVPHHVSLDMWLAVLATSLRPHVLERESLLVRTNGHIVAPSDGTFEAARSKVNAGEADRHRQRRRAQAAAYRSIVERYDERGAEYLRRHGLQPQPLTSAVLDDVRERVTHLEARGKMPDHRTKRLPIIVRELRSGRYNRYSAGALSALQDLAY